MLRVVNILLTGVFMFSILLSGVSYAEETPNATPIFNEVKVRFDTNNLLDVDEFIEISNPYTEPIDLNKYVIEYFNTTNPAAAQQPTQKPIGDGLLSAGSSLILAKHPEQLENALQLPFSSLSDTGGRLRLVTAEGDVVDEVAWTNSSALASPDGIAPAVVYQCNSSTAICTANRIQSIGRQLSTEGGYVIELPSWLLGTITPISSVLSPVPTDDEVTDTQENNNPPPTEQKKSCEAVLITEIFPNPDGSDTGREYIELYNPTDKEVDMNTCSIQLSSSSKSFEFNETLLPPKSFFTVADSVSGLTLPNGSGATVWLLTTNDEIQAISYPGEIDDDASWALIEGQWQQTYVPTPAQPNVAMPLRPCSSGQQRIADTNRCENIVTTAVASLTPCKPGQTRNPETNRCRTVVSAASLLVACRVGQERNPATNRCRNIASANALGACPEGQERNADTNRCRKVANNDGSTLASVTDVPSPTVSDTSKWWLAGAAILLALGYGAFEWRNDIKNVLANTKDKFKLH